jgi:hypothetical protein
MKGGHEILVWIMDKDGKEYACYLHDIKGKIRQKYDPTEEEKVKCLDINQIIGTERW